MRIDLARKVRSKSVRNDEKIDLSGNENKFYIAYKLLGKNLSHRTSTALQDLQYGKCLNFSPLRLNWTLIALLKNHVLKIFLAFFTFRHLKNKPWLPKYKLSEIYKLLENFNLLNFLDLLFIIFLLFIILYFHFLLLNFTMTFYLFLRWWHTSM